MTVPEYDRIVDDDEPFWDADSWAHVLDSTEIEFDWFAVDRNGALAAFASFGTGPIPAVVKHSRERFNRLILAVARLNNSSPVVFHQPVDGEWSSWGAYAKRGLYAFDNGDVHGRKPRHHYVPIAWSDRPLRLAASGIPEDLHGALPMIALDFGPDQAVPFAMIPP